MNSVRSQQQSFSRRLQQHKAVSEFRATVLGDPNGRTCDVKLTNGTILRNVRTIGAVVRDQDVDVSYDVGRPTVYGGSLASTVVKQGVVGSMATSTTSGPPGATPGAHNLNDGSIHLGTLNDSQAPQFLKTDGSRPLTGDLSVAGGVMIDGYDISFTFALQAAAITTLTNAITTLTNASYLTANAEAGLPNERVLLPTNIGPANALTVQDGGANLSFQIKYTSSSFPGPAPLALSSSGTGGLGIMRLGIGAADNTSYSLYGQSTLPAAFAGTLSVGTLVTTDAQFYVVSAIRSQFRIAYDSLNFMEYTVSSTGSASIFATGEDPTQAHIYLATAGGVSIGAGAPQAKIHVMHPTLPLIRAGRDAVTYMQLDVSVAGLATLSTSGSIPINSHLILAPGGNVGVNTGASVPAGKVEIRNANGQPQMVWSYDTAVNTSLTVSSQGNTLLQTYGSDLTLDLQPVGGLAGQKFLLPAHSYDINIGRLDRKFASAFIGELVVETLVAFDTAAVSGGRLLVTVSSPLKSDFAGGTSGSTSTPATIGNPIGTSSGTLTALDANWYVSFPAGYTPADGDVIIVALELGNSAAIVTAPNGWQQMPTAIPLTWGTRKLDAYYYVLDVTDTAPFGFTLSASSQGAWTAIVYRNVEVSGPFNNSNAQYNATSNTSMTAPTITTTVASTVIVMIGANSNSLTVTAPAGMTKRVEVFEANSSNRLVIFDKAQAVAGTTGSIVATNGGASASGVLLFALRPKTIVTGGTAATVINVKNNSFSVGDVCRMEANGHFEFMSVASTPVGTVGNYTMSVSRNLDGTGANDWLAGDVIVNTGKSGTGWLDLYSWFSSKGNPLEFIYTLDSTTWSGNLQQETNWTLFGLTTAQPGDATYYGMGGGMWSSLTHNLTDLDDTSFGGVWEYWNGSAWTALVNGSAASYSAATGASQVVVIGNLPPAPGTMVISWNAALQTNWTKNTVNGQSAYWVRWRVIGNVAGYAKNGIQRVLRAQAQYGPSIVGFVRNSTVFNDYDARFVVGNLHGHYDFGKMTFGFAAGRYTPNVNWIGIDELNGFRIMQYGAKLGTWEPNGTIKLWSNGVARIQLNPDGSGMISNNNITWDTAGNLTVTGTVNVTGGTATAGTENVVYNSTFTSNDTVEPTGWTIYNNNPGSASVASVINTGGVDGGFFYRITLSVGNAGNKGILADAGTVKRGYMANASYVISFYAKSSAARAFGMGLAWNTVPATTTVITNPNLSTSWQRYAFRIVWGSSTDTQLFITAAAIAGWTGSLDIDHVQVEAGTVLSQWKPATDELLPGTVIASMISVTTLSAIAADMGTLYAGTIRLGNQDALTYNSGTFTGIQIFKNGSTYRIAGYNAGTLQAYFDSDGKLKAGTTLIDSTGISVVPDSTLTIQSAYKFLRSGSVSSQLYAVSDVAENVCAIRIEPSNSYGSTLFLTAASNSSLIGTPKLAIVRIGAGPSENAAIYLQYSAAEVATISYVAAGGHLFSGRISRGLETPSSSTAAGSQGQIIWDANYVYICTATNTWKRAALSTF